MLSEKKCRGPCGQVKPLEEFTKSKAGYLGHTSRCKDCIRVQRATVRPTTTPIDRFFVALEKHKETTGRQYATMTDAFHVMTVILEYKEPGIKLEDFI